MTPTQRPEPEMRMRAFITLKLNDITLDKEEMEMWEEFKQVLDAERAEVKRLEAELGEAKKVNDILATIRRYQSAYAKKIAKILGCLCDDGGIVHNDFECAETLSLNLTNNLSAAQEALRWYADRNNILRADGRDLTDYRSNVQLDGGERARAALQPKEGR